MPLHIESAARKFHALEAEGKIDPASVKEFDNATDFSPLRKRRNQKPTDYGITYDTERKRPHILKNTLRH